MGFDLSVEPLRIILPVGISFYTFQTMSYSIDIYRNNLKPTKSLLDFALFVGFFPTTGGWTNSESERFSTSTFQ